VLQVNEVLTMHFGPQDVLVAVSLDFDDRFPQDKLSAQSRGLSDGSRRRIQVSRKCCRSLEKFAADSALEGTGFEPPVPDVREVPL
jgi:hypothetical protein